MGIVKITIQLKDDDDLELVPNIGTMELQQPRDETMKSNGRDWVSFSQEDWPEIKAAVDFYFDGQPPNKED